MLLSFLRRLVLLLLIGLASGPALAELEETYEGMLLPDNFETPIPITVQVKEQSGRLTGTVTTGATPPITAPISSGENRYGQCNMKILLTPTFTLRLFGSCQSTMFEGRYTIYTTREDDKPRGSFRLMRKEIKKREEDKETRRSTLTPPAGSVTDCIKTNTRCLLACPQGDYNAEFLCSNRCRHKYQACKAKFSAAPLSRSPANALPPGDGSGATLSR